MEVIVTVAQLSILHMCWFSPLPATKQIENAFTLPYIGANLGALYVNLSIQAVFSLFAIRIPPKIAFGTAFLGSCFKLVSVAPQDVTAKTGLLATGHALIGLGTVITLSCNL